MSPKTVALVGAVCLTTGWVLASVLTPPVARLQVLPQPVRAPQSNTAADDHGFSEQLKLRLQHAPAPPTPRRNPFRFGARERVDERTAQPRGDVDAPAPAPAAAPPPVAAGPRYTLAGIATSATPDGTVRTAILADGGSVRLVRMGDAIGGYTVVEMTDASVTLADSAGARYVLNLP